MRENPGFRFRWTRMNIWNWTQNHRSKKNPAVGEVPERDILVGDIVQHFKREWVSSETSEYLYKVLAFAQHTETERSWSFIRGCIRRSRYVPDRMICL